MVIWWVYAIIVLGFGGCVIMARKKSLQTQLDERNLRHGVDGPMIATFWKHGKFLRISCDDVSVSVDRHYAEIILNTTDARRLLFIISNDPDLEQNMAKGPNGESASFDGFLLRDPSGTTIEKITVQDNLSIH